MSDVIRIADARDLVPTRLFPHATFPFANFNVVQSAVFRVYEKDANVCVAASTSAGKTAVAEMLLSQGIREGGGKGLYISPLKALAQEKVDAWTGPGHHFADLKVSICTGDYVLTESRKQELQAADLILMTSEMLASRARNFKSEKNSWIQDARVVVVDESHLLTVPGRGDHLEVALMKLTEINPRVRIVFLSATLPNVDQVCGWLGTLNGKPTYLLESQYRPCPLHVHYVPYEKVTSDYEANEASKVWSAEQIIDRHPGDKFLVFAHTKRTGEMAKKRFLEKGIRCEFHNADLTKERRVEFEKEFRRPVGEGGIRVFLATSTLAWGIDAPARRVIVLGVHRGLTLVPAYDITQEVGRAGRPAYDPAGDAYVLLPDDKREFQKFKDHCRTPTHIESQLLSYVGNEESARHYKVLAFHVVSEIHRRGIRTRECFHAWYRRSLANHQANDLDAEIIDNVIDLLLGCYAIEEEDGQLDVTPVGTVASMLYYSPFDVADLKRNFHHLFAKGRDASDPAIAMALANLDGLRYGICSKAEREEIGDFGRSLTPIFGPEAFSDAAIKAGCCYHGLLTGRHKPILQAMTRGLQYDFDRTCQVLMLLDQMASKWGRRAWFQALKTRIKYGVSPHLVGLCGLPEVGSVRSQRLYDAGFRTVDDIVSHPERAARVLNFKPPRMEAILEVARKAALS